MTIIVSKAGKNAVRIEKTRIEKETFLQEYIHANPKCIPLDEIKPGINLDRLIVVREFSTGSGPIDALLIDENGGIFLVETKLYKNPDKRLVVAQILDYGASLSKTYRSLDEFATALDNAVSKSEGVGIHEFLKRSLGLSDEDIDLLVERAWGNLREGAYKFIVLMDTLEERLKDLILFLNKMSDFALFAVEVDYYEHEQYQIMRPKLFGVEAREAVGGREIRRWDEASFFADASTKLQASEVAALKKLYEFTKKVAAQIDWGGGVTGGSFNPKFPTISARSPYSVTSNGVLYLSFIRLDDTEHAMRVRDAMKQELEKLNGFVLPENFRDRQVSIQANVWCPVVDEFIGIVSNVIRLARSGPATPG